MFENLEDMRRHYEELMKSLTMQEIVSDINKYRKLIREQAELEPIYKAYLAFRGRSRAKGMPWRCFPGSRIRSFSRWRRRSWRRPRASRSV